MGWREPGSSPAHGLESQHGALAKCTAPSSLRLKIVPTAQVYEFGLTEESVEVLWFWDILGSETEKFRAAVLKFATGTARAPVDGASARSQFSVICCCSRFVCLTAGFANLRKGEKNGAIQRFTLFGNGTELAGAVNMRDDADLMRRAALESVQSGMGAGGTTFRRAQLAQHASHRTH
eukprot:SAG11_NODE_245_length_11735_cov_3.939068_4_plen_178_part_00